MTHGWARQLGPALLGPALLIGAMSPCLAQSPANVCPSPGVPSGVSLGWVAPQAGVDDIPMAILVLRSPNSPKTILDWYAHHWATLRQSERPIRYKSGSWQVVARRLAGCIESVQAQSALGAGTLAYIGISRIRSVTATPTLGPDVPHPPAARTLLNMDSQDAAQHGHTTLLALPMSPIAALDYYRHALTESGWAIQMGHQLSPTQAALMAQRHASRLEMAFSSIKGKTYALLTLVQN